MSLEYYKKQMIDLRSRLEKEREAKKKDNEMYARQIKSASSPTTKTNLKKYKIDKAAYHDRQIEGIKHQIDLCKANIERERKNK